MCSFAESSTRGNRPKFRDMMKQNSKKGCNCKQINENVANNMVERVLEAITISKDTLQPYVDVL